MLKAETVTAFGADSVPYLGLRRVSWVRIVLTEAGPVCEVSGIGHRLPRTRRVPLVTATTLAARGVPTVVRARIGADSAGD
jgi:hypothetical protein